MPYETPFDSLAPTDRVAERLEIEQELDRLRSPDLPRRPSLSYEIHDALSKIHLDPFDPDLNVKTLRGRCGIRDNNFSSRFRFTVGVTVRRYIENLRLDAAARLLEKLEVEVFDIALSVGYQHPQTFYTAFRRRFGCTPSGYRERHCETPTSRSGGACLKSIDSLENSDPTEISW